jgi:23S rRNA (cytidine1920-2'-O)/16S rRNA (cytidine1409-2'-O)-methyltransferase
MIAPIRRFCNIHIESDGADRNFFMKMRLDLLLVQRGFAKSRSQAQDLIKRGAVRVQGKVLLKAGLEVSEAEAIEVAEIRQYVARSAHKLIAALDRFGLSPAARTCLDAGASTGGFTEALLERGAACVYAVDVGHGQLHASLRADPRVICMEGVDARVLQPALFATPIEVVTCDVSFISLLKVLPHILPLAAPGAWLVALVKPQFEVGRALVGKGGIVKDEAAKRDAAARVAAFIEAARWKVRGLLPSPIKGQDGNEETLIAARLES